jgi:hypothetical protein
MTYTFWHAGMLLGQAELSHNPSNPAHRAGILAPTAYGLGLLPRLTQSLTVALGMKRLLDARNLSIDNVSPHALTTILAGTDVERGMRDMGQLLIDMEVRGSDDAPCPVSMLLFSDLDDMRRVGHAIGSNIDERLSHVPPGQKLYIASVVFQLGRPVPLPEAHHTH